MRQGIAESLCQLEEKVFAAAWAQGRMLIPEQALVMQGREMVPVPITTVTTPSPPYPASALAAYPAG